jgi:hypothetical protein
VLFVSVMLVNLLLQDGRANYMEGVMRECERCSNEGTNVSKTVADGDRVAVMSLYLVIALSYIVQ